MPEVNSDLSTKLNRVRKKQTLILTHRGRKSGKSYQVTIWFVAQGDTVFIGSANVNRQWVRNVQETPAIKLSIGDEDFSGNARFLNQKDEHENAMALIRRKYWIFSPLLLLGRLAARIGLMQDKTAAFKITLSEERD